MLKNLRAAVLAVLALFLLLGPNLTPPIDQSVYLEYEIVAGQDSIPAGAVRLTWEVPYSEPGDLDYGYGCFSKKDAEDKPTPGDWQFIVLVDGIDVDTLDATTDTSYGYEYYPDMEYTVYTPCASIAVCPYYEGERYEYGADGIEFDYREDDEFHIWIREEFDYEYSDFPSGIAFEYDGCPSSRYVSYGGYWSGIDYYVDTNFVLHAGINHDSPLNGRQSYISKADETTWDEMSIAPGFNEESYLQSVLLEEGGLYFLLVEPSSLNMKPAGQTYFAKIEVTEIEGEKITLRTILQAESGFRWLTGDLPNE